MINLPRDPQGRIFVVQGAEALTAPAAPAAPAAPVAGADRGARWIGLGALKVGIGTAKVAGWVGLRALKMGIIPLKMASSLGIATVKKSCSLGINALKLSLIAPKTIYKSYNALSSCGKKVLDSSPPVIKKPVQMTKDVIKTGLCIAVGSLIYSNYKKIQNSEVADSFAKHLANFTQFGLAAKASLIPSTDRIEGILNPYGVATKSRAIAKIAQKHFETIQNTMGPILSAVANGLAVAAAPLLTSALANQTKGAVLSLGADGANALMGAYAALTNSSGRAQLIEAAALLVTDGANALQGAVKEAVIDTANDAFQAAPPLALSAAKFTVTTVASAYFETFKETAKIVFALDYTTYGVFAGALFVQHYCIPKFRQYSTGVPLPTWISRRDARAVTPLSRAFASLKNRFWKSGELKPVLNENIREHVEKIIDSNKNIMKNGGFFKNLLLLGDPGIGKTMLAKTIARESNFNYVEMSGADFACKIPLGLAIPELKQLIEFSEKSLYPTVLLIDEIDAICPYRDPYSDDKPPTREQKEFRSALLSAVQASKKLLIVVTTNLESDMDTGLLSRFGNRIQMALPDLQSRIKILTQNIDKYLGNIPERATCLSPENIEKLAAKMEGMSGRTLFQFVDELVMQKPASLNHVLTQEGVDEVLDFYLKTHERDQRAKAAREKRKLEKDAATYGISLARTEAKPVVSTPVVATPAPVKPVGVEMATQTDPLPPEREKTTKPTARSKRPVPETVKPRRGFSGGTLKSAAPGVRNPSVLVAG